jgi:CPA1 family monovalent cation:H+ antiporter
MHGFEIIILVFSILIVLMAVANRFKIPSAILLVCVGVTLGFFPALPAFTINPEIVFLIFLPPILYDAASHTSWLDFKAEIKPISTLAILLVFFTSVSVAVASHFFIPGFSWPMAFVLGAIVSPPDAVAAAGIIKGLGLNRRVITILQGESLVNDASALIAYRFAIGAMTTGTFMIWQAGLEFLILVVGGVTVGLVVGYLLIQIHKRILNNSVVSTSFTMLTPFISYLAAERLHTSGILAVVCTGLIISWRAPEIFTYHTRIRNRAVWDTAIFLLNGFIFILIGLQLPVILSDMHDYSKTELLVYGLLVSGVTIVVRVLWVFGVAYSPLGKNSKPNEKDPYGDNWKNVLIVAWTGTRGVVSLATALALPLTLTSGEMFPQRSLVLFLSFVVIFMTLVVQGISLPVLIRVLGVKPHPEQQNEERELRLLVANSSLNFIDNDLPIEVSDRDRAEIRKPYIEIIASLSKELINHEDQSVDSKNTTIEPADIVHRAIHTFQRELLVGFHKEGTFGQSAIRRMEQELDHAELLINRAARKVK